MLLGGSATGRRCACRCHKNNLQAEIIEEESGPESGTLHSALLHLEGSGAEQFVAGYEGTIQWIGTSTFRPGHKTKTHKNCVKNFFQFVANYCAE